MADDQQSPSLNITEDQLRHVVRSTVHETFLYLGIDTSNPLEMQKDFQSLREWREMLTSIRKKGTLAAVGLFTAAFIGFVIAEFRHVLMLK